MAYLYILQSERNGKYYVGSTGDIDRRIDEHKKGKHLSSKRLMPIKLVFCQEVSDIKKAREAEKKIKKYKRRDFVEKIVKDGCFRFIDS